MTTMKIVVNRNRNTRTVINTGLEQQLIAVNSGLQRHAYTAANLAWSERNNLFQEMLRRPINRLIADQKRPQRKKGNARYRMKTQVWRDLAITREKFAQLSVNVSADSPKDEKIEASAERGAIQLREPVLQFSRSYEEASPLSANAASSISTEKTDALNESLIRIYNCRMCPNYAVPEVHECPSGHLICHECWLLSSHCALCFDTSSDESTRCNTRSTFRRIHGLEKIASLLVFPCRWRQRGCSESFGPGDWRNHVDSCRHAEVQLHSLTFASQESNSDLSDYEIVSEDNVDGP